MKNNINNRGLKYNIYFQDNHMSWAGHKFYTREVVAILKPKIIVELRTYKGTSLFCLIEGAERLNTKTDFFGIDTWEEDSYSGKYEGNLILENINYIIKKCYPNTNISLIRKRFNEALLDFDKVKIDLLQIDRRHPYEAFSEDYNNWKSNLSDTGVCLFHDIKSEKESFEVNKFWEELKTKNEFSLKFEHSNGLGVLCKNEKIYNVLKKHIEENKEAYLKNSYKTVKDDLYFAN